MIDAKTIEQNFFVGLNQVCSQTKKYVDIGEFW